MQNLLRHAKDQLYAVGYFESWDMGSLLSVVDAAERTRSPVIIGFSGNFLGNPQRHIREDIFHYGALVRAVAEQAKVPCAMLLNESPDMGILLDSLRAGFNAVMYQKPGECFDVQVENHCRLAAAAHAVGAAVEAEVGELPTADIGVGSMTAGENTDIEQAEYLVKKADLDALAVAVGNVHLLEDAKSALDFHLLEKLAARIPVPLVLHGGTGIAPEECREAIRLGVAKLNVGTVFKRMFIDTVKNELSAAHVEKTDPHEIIGSGGTMDVLMKARQVMSDAVAGFMELAGSVGKADLF